MPTLINKPECIESFLSVRHYSRYIPYSFSVITKFFN